MTYTIVRSRRKTISIHVFRDGRVEIRAPLRASEARIRAFAEEKEPWIAQKVQEFAAMQADLREQTGKLPYLGDWREVRTAVGRPYLADDAWYLPALNRAEALDRLLSDLARDYIAPRAEKLAKLHGFSYTDLHITSAKTRFGSCSGKNSLNFTKYLILYEPACIDYVILHELCHTRHHDHSPAFYRELGRVCPAHEALRARMRTSAFLGDLVREFGVS